MDTDSENQYAPPGAAPPRIADEPELDREKAAAFVGDKFPYYEQRWKRTSSWNWASFFLGVFWVFYRKMYAFGLILLAIITAESLVAELFFTQVMGLSETPRVYDRISQMVYSISLGMFGNHLYKLHTQKKIAQLAAFDSRSARQAALREAGGVNDYVPIIALALIVILVLIAVFSPQATALFPSLAE